MNINIDIDLNIDKNRSRNRYRYTDHYLYFIHIYIYRHTYICSLSDGIRDIKTDITKLNTTSENDNNDKSKDRLNCASIE